MKNKRARFPTRSRRKTLDLTQYRRGRFCEREKTRRRIDRIGRDFWKRSPLNAERRSFVFEANRDEYDATPNAFDGSAPRSTPKVRRKLETSRTFDANRPKMNAKEREKRDAFQTIASVPAFRRVPFRRVSFRNKREQARKNASELIESPRRLRASRAQIASTRAKSDQERKNEREAEQRTQSRPAFARKRPQSVFNDVDVFQNASRVETPFATRAHARAETRLDAPRVRKRALLSRDSPRNRPQLESRLNLSRRARELRLEKTPYRRAERFDAFAPQRNVENAKNARSTRKSAPLLSTLSFSTPKRVAIRNESLVKADAPRSKNAFARAFRPQSATNAKLETRAIRRERNARTKETRGVFEESNARIDATRLGESSALPKGTEQTATFLCEQIAADVSRDFSERARSPNFSRSARATSRFIERVREPDRRAPLVQGASDPPTERARTSERSLEELTRLVREARDALIALTRASSRSFTLDVQ